MLQPQPDRFQALRSKHTESLATPCVVSPGPHRSPSVAPLIIYERCYGGATVCIRLVSGVCRSSCKRRLPVSLEQVLGEGFEGEGLPVKGLQGGKCTVSQLRGDPAGPVQTDDRGIGSFLGFGGIGRAS